VPIPKLSNQQLASAREAATQARRLRADFKNRVKRGELSIVEALQQASADEVLGQVRVIDLLKCIPRVGDKRAARIMERLDVSPNRRVRGLGRLQYAALVKEFSGR